MASLRARARGRALAWLPRGDHLRPDDWRSRHEVVCLVLACHLPALVLLAVLRGRSGDLAGVVLPLGLLLAGARLPALNQLSRSLSAALGLLTASALVVHLTDGQTEAYFHSFVTVAVIALYQDWAVYVLALLFVLVQHGLAASTAGSAGSGPWDWAALHAAAVLAESAVLVLFWRTHELSRDAEERARAALSAGDASVRARLAETDRMRADLIGTVSHEFRTPLTGIRGAALTLLKRGDQLDKESRDRLLHAVLDQQERLSRLLENMLLAAQATAADPCAVAELDAVAAEVAMLAGGSRGPARVSVVVEPGTVARIERQALHQVLANLVDNALQHGAPGSSPLVAGGRDERGVWLTVSNEGRLTDVSAAGRLFEPFTQASSGVTREHEGIGMGLYVVWRLVEVYGGSVHVRSRSGWVTVEVLLRPAVETPVPRAAGPVPAPR